MILGSLPEIGPIVAGAPSLSIAAHGALKAARALWYTDFCQPMSFRQHHKKIYAIWVVISVLAALSMILFLVAPLFLY